MGEKVYIYGLVDPRDDSIRYVGKSINPKLRWLSHIRDKSVCRKSDWIAELLGMGLTPGVKILCVASSHDWKVKEMEWIKTLSKQHDLFNTTEGGESSLTCEELGKKPARKRKDYITIEFSQSMAEQVEIVRKIIRRSSIEEVISYALSIAIGIGKGERVVVDKGIIADESQLKFLSRSEEMSRVIEYAIESYLTAHAPETDDTDYAAALDAMAAEPAEIDEE